jgi:hypothetical protein
VHGRYRDYPVFVLPHKHYVAAVVDAAIGARAQDESWSTVCSVVGVHDSLTVRRWVQWFVLAIAGIDHHVEVRVRGMLEGLGLEWQMPARPASWTLATTWQYLGALLSCSGSGPPLQGRSRSFLALLA